MKNTICSLLIIFISTLAIQAKGVDSLIHIITTQKLSAEEQMDVCLKIIGQTHASDMDITIFYAKKGLAIAEQKKDKSKIYIFTQSLCVPYDVKTMYDTSGMYYKRALALAEEMKDEKELVSMYRLLAYSNYRQNKYIAAQQYCMKMLEISERIGDTLGCLAALCNIGSLYREMNNPERAIYYLEQSVLLYNGKPYTSCVGLYEFGLAYMSMGDLDKALQYELQALTYSKVIHYTTFEIYSLQALARIYILLKDYNKALEYANESMRLAKILGDPKQQVNGGEVLSTIYREQKRYKESEETALWAWVIDSTAMDTGANLAFNIAWANIFLENKEKSARFFQKYTDLMKQYNEKNFHETIMDMEVKYETEKKELRIASLEEKQKLYIWIGVAGAAVLLLAFGLLFYRHRLNVQKRKLSEQQIKQLEQEKQLLATQSVLDGETAERTRLARDLHDGLGGMLSVVKLNLKDMKSFAIMDGPDVNRFGTALDMLDQSIGELRRVAHHIMPDSLIRYGLKVSLEDFCRAIPGAHFQYLGEDPRLDSRLEVLIYRCAYELVNNAVKHANATSINIQLMVDNGLVSLTVQDNGVGFDPETSTGGTGLENIHTRVAAYNGKMTIVSLSGKGTEISIEIEKSEQ